ncbi:hypothetical protein DPMN_050328 [Dreissena polymorpha]|uniref:Uncharacterized protein n=1 Tax=Dreissena polymorpha TaxID=45954 RepID=A0A9D4HM67_DREPO|nr:hypothetical protein DPMN_050328 [Dreissena polymorpha]
MKYNIDSTISPFTVQLTSSSLQFPVSRHVMEFSPNMVYPGLHEYMTVELYVVDVVLWKPSCRTGGSWQSGITIGDS